MQGVQSKNQSSPKSRKDRRDRKGRREIKTIRELLANNQRRTPAPEALLSTQRQARRGSRSIIVARRSQRAPGACSECGGACVWLSQKVLDARPPRLPSSLSPAGATSERMFDVFRCISLCIGGCICADARVVGRGRISSARSCGHSLPLCIECVELVIGDVSRRRRSVCSVLRSIFIQALLHNTWHKIAIIKINMNNNVQY